MRLDTEKEAYLLGQIHDRAFSFSLTMLVFHSFCWRLIFFFSFIVSVFLGLFVDLFFCAVEDKARRHLCHTFGDRWWDVSVHLWTIGSTLVLLCCCFFFFSDEAFNKKIWKKHKTAALRLSSVFLTTPPIHEMFTAYWTIYFTAFLAWIQCPRVPSYYSDVFLFIRLAIFTYDEKKPTCVCRFLLG